MNKRITVTMLAALVTLSSGFAQEELVKGRDRIDVPAIGDSLCIHNLFQSNMVLQRGQPVPLRGWAAPGETVTVSFAGQTQTTTAADDGSAKSSPGVAALLEIV